MEITDKDWPVPLRFSKRNGLKLAWRFHQGDPLTVIYTGGFHSNMNGEKANKVFKHALQKGHSALCFDYSGHGSSEGEFSKGTISEWLEDTLHIISEASKGPLLFVGSSMGAWIALLASLRLRERVKGILTIAAATDMTEKFIWEKCDEEFRESLLTDGFFEWDSEYDEEPYRITMNLIEDGRSHLILENSIPLTCPVRMIHGTEDQDIDWENSLETMNRLESADVTLKLIKGAPHRLSEPENIKEIIRLLDQLLEKI